MAATVVEKAFCVLELAKTNCDNLVQRHFGRRYGKHPPTRQSIYDWNKNFKKLVAYVKVRVLGDHQYQRKRWS
jgi:hypothetical protein